MTLLIPLLLRLTMLFERSASTDEMPAEDQVFSEEEQAISMEKE